MQTCAEVEHVNDVEKVKAVGNTATVPIVKLSTSDADKRGSVQVITPDGLPAHITTEPCDEFTHEDDYKLTEHLYQGRGKVRSNRQKRTPLSDPSQLPKAFVDRIPTVFSVSACNTRVTPVTMRCLKGQTGVSG